MNLYCEQLKMGVARGGAVSVDGVLGVASVDVQG
jgi:hypothetical protein